MKTAIVALNERGLKTANKLAINIPQSKIYFHKKDNIETGIEYFDDLNELTRVVFKQFKAIIFCMACGIAVRVIAGHLKDKHTDPAVVVVDDNGRYAISLLSGHEGGANGLAVEVANVLGAEPVITTGSDSARNIVIGVGARRGVTKKEVTSAVRTALSRAKRNIRQVRCIASIDLKKDETGLKQACRGLGVPLRVVSSDVVKIFQGNYGRSKFVREKIGVEGVCEPCALIVSRNPELILKKLIIGKVTVAVAEERSA